MVYGLKLFHCYKNCIEQYVICFSDYSNLINSQLFHKITNHPVHIIDDDKKISPSALIPFCGFGQKIMGSKIEQFDVPVCNSFKSKVLNDQLCYEVDPNDFVNIKEFNEGLKFYVDTNVDRQYPTRSADTDFMIYLDTLGRSYFCLRKQPYKL